MNTQSTNQSQNFSQSQNSDDQADSDPTFSTQERNKRFAVYSISFYSLSDKKSCYSPYNSQRTFTFLNILNYIREIQNWNSCIKYIILINFVTGSCRIKSVLLTAEPKT